MADGRKPWHRRPDETDAQFSAFRGYLALGNERSILESYRRYSGIEGATQAGGTYLEWVSKNEWIKRVTFFDQWQGVVEDTAFERGAAVEQKKIAMRRAKANDTAWDMATKLIEKAKEILALPIVEERIEKDGKVIVQVPVKVRMSDAARMIEIADKLARLTSDLHTELVSFDLNAQLKRVAEETGVPFHVLTEEYRQLTGKKPRSIH